MTRPAATSDPRDERALMGLAAGVLWLVAALTTGAGALLPGSPHVIGWVFVALEAFMIVYAIGCLTRRIPWDRVSMEVHAVTTALLLPLIGAGLWATGGAESFLYPMMLFPLMYVVYFFDRRLGNLLVAELIAVYATPLLYTRDATNFPARALTFSVVAIVLAVTVRLLKDRLLSAESRQREMARTDALTGLANRRGFDDALHEVFSSGGQTERGRRFADDADHQTALVLFDLDDFKAVNDSRGHAAGDDLLRSVAAHCHAVVRAGDILARIGGDEFALVAPGAGAAGAVRLASALAEAIAAAGADATIAWALLGDDGDDPDALLRAADRRLYERKAELRSGRVAVAR